MGWAKFDGNRHQNPKIRRVGLEASGLDCHGITYASGMETDGFLDENVVEMLAGVKHWRKIVAKLVVENRWERDDERSGWWIHDYLEFNPSRDEIAAQREIWATRAKAGASARWNKGDAKKHASSMQEASPKHRDSNAPIRTVNVINKEVFNESKDSLNPPFVEQGKLEESKTPSESTDEKPSENSSNANASQRTANGEATKNRKRDLFFDAMAEACGHDLTQLTKSSAASIAKATSEIRPVCKTPDEIWAKAAIYKKIHPDWVLTPSALAKYWSELTQERADNQGSDKYQAHRDFEDEIFGRKPQDPTSLFRLTGIRGIEPATTDAKVSATPLQLSAPEPVAALSPSERNGNQVPDKHQDDKDPVAEIPEQLPQGDAAAVQTAAGAPIGNGTTEDGGFPTPPQRSAPERPTTPSQSERTFDDDLDNYEDYDSHADDNFEDYEDYEDRDTYDSDASGDGCDWGGPNA